MKCQKLAPALLGATLLLLASGAAAEIAVPPFTARVIDQTNTLRGDQRQSLEQKLAGFEARRGSQIAVLLVPTTQPETIEQYALRVAEQWRPGRQGIDDGVLLLVAKEDRALRIEVGYGLEGALTDAGASRIIREVIVPLFKNGDLYAGIEAGVDRVIRVIEGEPLPAPQPQRYENEGRLETLLPLILVVTLVAGGIFRTLFGRLGGATATGGLIALLTWLLITVLGLALAAGAIAFLFTLLSGNLGGRRGWSSRGRYSGWGGGWHSGGSSGSLGGGFSGGSGGSFGGGGASGRW
ncbi:MAG: TPM domain-containing protein [Chromatiales bacterium]